SEGRVSYKWIVASVVILGVFMSILDQTIVNIALPTLETDFGADVHSVQWVLTAYILTQGVATPATAYFANRFGIKRFYIISLAAFTAGSALCGLAWSLPVLIFFRVLQGAGGAALFPLSITLLFREFPPQERGMAMGLFGVPALLAPAIGPTLGGYLVTAVGWQLIFYINVPIGIAAVILSFLFLREYRQDAHAAFDFPGFILAAIGLAAVLYGINDASTDGWTSGTVLGFLALGILALVIFTAFEIMLANRGGRPLLDMRLFRNRAFSVGSIAYVFVIFSLFGGLFLLPIYLQNIRQLSAFQAGLILLPQALASMVSVVVGGRLVDRIGVRAVMIPGLLLLGFANYELSLLTIYSPYGWIQVMLILRGVALGFTVQPLTVAILSEISSRDLPQASALNTVIRAVSSSLGIGILATLVQTQAQVHFAHLAEQVTASSRIGQLLPELEALFVAHGYSLSNAHTTAIQYIALFLQQISFTMAVQDAFLLTVGVVVIAIIATLFVGGRRKAAAKQSGAAHAGEESEERILIMAE
ncbi:MAG: DHA2 family efflux MFS transporter permease subunit, partial [Ktedonobacteraceae bacterium]